MRTIFKSIAVVLATAGIMTSFSSCENDAPEINATWSVSYITDFAKLVEAVNQGNANLKLAIDGLGTKVDQNGNLIVESINSNGDKVSNAIAEGFKKVESALGTVNNNLVLSVNENTKALVSLNDDVTKALKEVTQAANEVGGKVVLAIGENGQTVALAVKENGEAIHGAIVAETDAINGKGQLLTDAINGKGDKLTDAINSQTDAIKAQTDAIKLLPNTIVDAIGDVKVAIQTLADEAGKIEGAIAKLDEGLNGEDGTLAALGTKLDGIKDATEQGFTNLTDVTADKLDGVFNEVKDINDNVGTIIEIEERQIDLTDVTEQLKALTNTLAWQLGGIQGQIAMNSLTISTAVGANTLAIGGVQNALYKFDADTNKKLGQIVDQLEKENKAINAQTGAITGAINAQTGAIGTTIATQLLTLKTALVTVINKNGKAIAQGIVNVESQLKNMNNNIKNVEKAIEKNTRTIAGKLGDIEDELDDIGDAIEINGKKINFAIGELTKEQQKSLKALKDEVDKVGGKIVTTLDKKGNGIIAAIDNESRVLGQINTTLKTTNAKLDKFDRDFNKFSRSLTATIVEGNNKIEKAIVHFDKSNAKALEDLEKEVKKTGGNIVSSIDKSRRAIVAAIDDNGEVISDAIEGLAFTVRGSVRDLGRQLENVINGQTRTLKASIAGVSRQLALDRLVLLRMNDNLNDISEGVSATVETLESGLSAISGQLGRLNAQVAAFNFTFTSQMGLALTQLGGINSKLGKLNTLDQLVNELRKVNSNIVTQGKSLEDAIKANEVALEGVAEAINKVTEDGEFSLNDIVKAVEGNHIDQAQLERAIRSNNINYVTLTAAIAAALAPTNGTLSTGLSNLQRQLSNINGSVKALDIEGIISAIDDNTDALTETVTPKLGEVVAALGELGASAEDIAKLLGVSESGSVPENSVLGALNKIAGNTEALDGIAATEVIRAIIDVQALGKLGDIDESLGDINSSIIDLGNDTKALAALQLLDPSVEWGQTGSHNELVWDIIGYWPRTQIPIYGFVNKEVPDYGWIVDADHIGDFAALVEELNKLIGGE